MLVLDIKKDAVLQRQLLDVASETKIALSDNDVTDININGWKGEITRAEFESLIQSLVSVHYYLFVAH